MSSIDLQQGQESLPEHWEMRIDPRTGLPYYLNHVDQFTTWDDPRLVENPRGMLNNMGSMLRPSAPLERVRQKSAEPTPTSNRYFSAPSQPQTNYYAQSLPRRRPSNNHPPHSTMRHPFGDEWFSRFTDVDNDFFGSAWPFKSHTIQRQYPTRARSVQPESMRTREMPRQHTEDDSYRRAADSTDGRYQGEHYIIPTRYKKNSHLHPLNNNNMDQRAPADFQTQKPTDTNQHSPRRECDDSNEDAILRRMNSANEQQDDAENMEECTSYGQTVVEDDGESERVAPIKIVIEEPEKSAASDVDPPTSKGVDGNKASQSNTACQREAGEKVPADLEAEKQDDEEEEELKKLIGQSYEAIKKILSDVNGYKNEVEVFKGMKDSKEYRYLDEMLTRCQLGLDDVQTHGDIELRKSRKHAVNYIETILKTLEEKAASS